MVASMDFHGSLCVSNAQITTVQALFSSFSWKRLVCMVFPPEFVATRVEKMWMYPSLC